MAEEARTWEQQVAARQVRLERRCGYAEHLRADLSTIAIAGAGALGVAALADAGRRLALLEQQTATLDAVLVTARAEAALARARYTVLDAALARQQRHGRAVAVARL